MRRYGGKVFVVPLQNIRRRPERFGAAGWSTIAFVLALDDAVQEEPLAGCDMPRQVESAHRFRIRFPVALVGGNRFDHAPCRFVLPLDLGEINLIQQKLGLFGSHSSDYPTRETVRDAAAWRIGVILEN